MRYLILACDYDGTLAHHGQVDEPTVAALEQLLATGRKLLLVTGRELDELLGIFPRADLFEWIVAENGALLYHPRSRQEKLLAERPAEEFISRLRARGVGPISVGRAIVATWQPHENTVLQVIQELGLELQVIFNKGAVMVLPTGVNKASGLTAALRELGLSPHNVVAVGDAENDHTFLGLCECGAAVANALPALKERADIVTQGDHGAGVRELIEELVATDLAGREDRLTRHHLLLGTHADSGAAIRLPPYRSNVLIAGPSGSGKSTSATSLLERLTEQHYQFCLIDPEGDYDQLEGTVVLGSPKQGPTADEVLHILDSPERNVVVNLIGLPIADRPPFFLALLSRLLELRSRTGRPHWLVVDEAHHLLPASWEPGPRAWPQGLDRTLLITVHPEQVAPAVLANVDTILAVGAAPEETLRQFCGVVRCHPPGAVPEPGSSGEVVLWRRGAEVPFRVRVEPPRTERRRHVRKYAAGELSLESSFYFQGPEGKLNLRAQNLHLFLQLGEGLDEETWLYHLHQGDYSRWFREKIKDEELAAEAAAVETAPGADAKTSRELIRAAVEKRYTLPAATPLPVPGAG